MKQYAGVLAGLAVLVVLFSLLPPNFLVFNNLLNIVLQVSITAIIAFGMTYVLLVGEIDLSVCSTVVLAGALAALCLAHGFGLASTIALMLLAGIAFGFTNGALSSFLRIPSVIATLATMGIFRCLGYIVSGGIAISVENERFLALGNSRVLAVPRPVWILLGLLLLNHFLLSRTVFGHNAYLTGGNREAALYSGVDVGRLKVAIFILSALLAPDLTPLLSAAERRPRL
jgi:ribose transport system permease protein